MTPATPTGPSAPATSGAAATAGDDRPRRRTGRTLLWVLGGLAVLALVVWQAWPRTSGLPLDPTNPGPDGTRAVAEVLRRQGVQVDVVRTRQALRDARLGRDTTLVVSQGPMLTSTGLEQVRASLPDAGRGVLLGLREDALHALDLPVALTGPAESDPTVASCSDPVARTAHRVSPVRRGYRVDEDAGARPADADPGTDPETDPDEVVEPLGSSWPGLTTHGCYPTRGEGHALLTVEPGRGHPRLDLLAPAELLTNETVTTQDDAALALRLLGAERRVVWYSPDVSDLAGAEGLTGGPRVVPPWFQPLVVLLGGAVLLAMWWRGRRLGPLAVEPLPVLVPASETTVARGRLYRRAHGRAHAGEVLRAATRRRLAARLGLARDARGEDLVQAVAAACGRAADDVRPVLDGPAPTTDAELARLGTQLTELEHETGRP